MKIASITILSTILILNAQNINVQFDNNVKEYANCLSRIQTIKHRSGLLLDTTDIVSVKGPSANCIPEAFSSEEEIADVFLKLKNNCDFEYSIDYTYGEKIQDALSGFYSALGLKSSTYDTASKCLIFNRNDSSGEALFSNQAIINIGLSEADLIKKGKSLAQKYLAPFSRHVEYECNDKTYLDGKLFTMDLRFRRIFAGGAIFENISYIYLTVDKNGELIEIRIKWPKFIILGEKQTAINILQAMNFAQDEYAQASSLLLEDGQKKAPISARIVGVCCGWIGAVVGTQNLITPCFSFCADVSFPGNEKYQKYFQVPKLSKYLQ